MGFCFLYPHCVKSHLPLSLPSSSPPKTPSILRPSLLYLFHTDAFSLPISVPPPFSALSWEPLPLLAELAGRYFLSFANRGVQLVQSLFSGTSTGPNLTQCTLFCFYLMELFMLLFFLWSVSVLFYQIKTSICCGAALSLFFLSMFMLCWLLF